MINGTTSFGSAVKLQVRGASSVISDGAQIFDITTTAAASGGTRLAFGVYEDQYSWIRSYESGVGSRDLVFAGVSEYGRFNTSGQFNIGTEPASGAGFLNVKPGSEDTYIKFRRAADFDGTFDGTAIDNRNSANNANRDLIVRFGKMAIWAGGTEKYRIGTAGQFGIGGANYGTAGQVLTSTGSSSGLSWTTPSSGVSMVDEWRLSTNLTNGGSESYITSNWVRNSTNGFSGGVGVIGGAIGSAMSVSSGYFSFPSTGIYKVEFNINYSINDADTKFFEANIIGTKNNSTYTVLARSYGPPIHSNVHNEPMYGHAYTALIFDVTNTSNCKFRLNYSCGTSSNTIIGGGYNATCVTVTRLGDT